MGEVAAKRPEGVRALTVKRKPSEAQAARAAGLAPSVALTRDSSPIEGERGAGVIPLELNVLWRATP